MLLSLKQLKTWLSGKAFRDYPTNGPGFYSQSMHTHMCMHASHTHTPIHTHTYVKT